MKKIRKLSPEIIEKIAAGEVIDRPVAVVKELLENSLDAGAEKVTINLEKGGLKKIEVIDDGHGMSEEDIPLCFLPHTTSKLTEIEGLGKVLSFGFRGEALASIVAVSQVEVESRTKKQKLGKRIVIKNGKVIEEQSHGMPVGTRVVVRSLFSRLPARKKFVQNIQRELQYIIKEATQRALAHHTVEFALHHEGKELLRVFPQKNQKSRLAEILGEKFVQLSLPYSFDHQHVTITGFLGKPQLSLRSRSRQYVLVNNRPVRNRRVVKAIRDGFGPLLEPKAHPAFVLSVTVPGDFFDANIHPRKEEIEIYDLESVLPVLRQFTQEFLREHDLTYQVDELTRTTPWLLRDRSTDSALQHNLKEKGKKKTLWRVRKDTAEIEEVFQLHDTYLLYETPQGMMMVDQHAAHERILFEELRRTFDTETQKGLSQKLPKAISVSLSPSEKQLFEQYADVFSKLGFVWRGSKRLSITAVPEVMVGTDTTRVVKDFLSDLEEYGELTKQDLLSERTLSFMACRTAIKAGEVLEMPERVRLVKKLQELDDLYTCPHGRPLKAEVATGELEKLFHRKK